MHRTEIVKGVASIKQGFWGVAPKHFLGALLNGPPRTKMLDSAPAA